MANSAGKFGPYPAPVPPAPVRGAGANTGTNTARLPVRHQTGAEQIRSRIALQVRLGQLAPGERLPDTGVIAEDLSMSEMTVRRALETMCQDGLLDRRRGRVGGTFVAPKWDAVVAAFRDEEQAAALEDFLLLLECGLVARSADELPPAWDTGLRTVVDEMNATADHTELLRLETRFHLSLAEALGHGMAGEEVADLLGRGCLVAAVPAAAELQERNKHHADLLSALELGRLDAAVAAVKAHQVDGVGRG
ncbi:GntR family transcriptional regulator [Catenulispora sp. NL8]|uniref:GntR family transcriptional regulator n=1 Tax=Catenulispora pinistramenti TaxID=2705254 RepID=A0ABS5KYJ6_9ACTN|nr:GntR family transcriptional regulator [Catenulispora pinistramenti]MBS2551025.1 GntR family transcriptional regulator [Catenulispora pinistramenti]